MNSFARTALRPRATGRLPASACRMPPPGPTTRSPTRRWISLGSRGPWVRVRSASTKCVWPPPWRRPRPIGNGPTRLSAVPSTNLVSCCGHASDRRRRPTRMLSRAGRCGSTIRAAPCRSTFLPRTTRPRRLASKPRREPSRVTVRSRGTGDAAMPFSASCVQRAEWADRPEHVLPARQAKGLRNGRTRFVSGATERKAECRLSAPTSRCSMRPSKPSSIPTAYRRLWRATSSKAGSSVSRPCAGCSATPPSSLPWTTMRATQCTRGGHVGAPPGPSAGRSGDGIDVVGSPVARTRPSPNRITSNGGSKAGPRTCQTSPCSAVTITISSIATDGRCVGTRTPN